MKASELIEKLQKQIEKHGDYDVCVSVMYDSHLYENVRSVTFEDIVNEFEDAKDEENYITVAPRAGAWIETACKDKII